MVWATQLVGGPDLPPFGAEALARHSPKVRLSKLAGRATPAAYLLRGTRTCSVACLGMLTEEFAIAGAAERVTTRAVLISNGMWQFLDILAARLEMRGRPAVRPQGSCQSAWCKIKVLRS